MNELYRYIVEKKHHRYRRKADWKLADACSSEGLPPQERMCRRFERLCAEETPVLLPGEKICFLRTVSNLPDILTEEEWAEIRKKYFIHELGYMSNVSPDYEGTIRNGLLAKKASADEYGRRSIDALIGLSDRYREKAYSEGKKDIADVLTRIPRYGARNFREALQFFRIIHFGLWLEGNYHNTVGRFDTYMYPYFEADMEAGLYTEETVLELLEDFFLSFNKDSDLYAGVQQGDNGQSLMLGGCDRDGNEVFSLLSELCLKASHNLKMIDPKINLRVNKNTPVRIFELGSELTKAGLGFPQYSNDDVVMPGLERLGYTHEDASDYTVAACWEFIIPKAGTDIPNISALSFAKAVNNVFEKKLQTAGTYQDFFEAVKSEIKKQADSICERIKDLWFIPSPLLNAIEGFDVSKGGKYNNFGIHGTGIATAADSLAAIKKYIYEDGSISKAVYQEAVATDFKKHGELLPILRYEAPKLGNDDDYADSIMIALMDAFSESLKGKVNCRGGCYRAGTGSAMYYLWHAAELGASPDGRRKGEAFGTNFSVSLFSRVKGPVSVIKSMTKPCFENMINGGPLTLEFHSSVFHDADSAKKVGMLVKYFITLGGHQLQLNAVNTEVLKDAQLHPERYPQLVVRIWGWSAYFIELDKEYQDHVIARQAYTT